MVKIHGNWCGPNWTAGRKISARDYKLAGGTFKSRCIDKLDCACRTHDKGCSRKSGCNYDDDTKLMEAADKILANPLNFFTNPVMYAKAQVIRDTMNVVRFTR